MTRGTGIWALGVAFLTAVLPGAVGPAAARPATAAARPATAAARPATAAARPAARTPSCAFPVDIATVSADLRLHASKAQPIPGSKTPPLSYACDYDAYDNRSLKGFAQLEYILPSKADLAGAIPVFLAVYHGKKIASSPGPSS